MSPYPVVRGLHLVLSRDWGYLKVLGLDPIPELQGQGWVAFCEQKGPICMPFYYIGDP